MSRYMWRNYKKMKKRTQLDSSHLEESRKVPLTPAETAKAYRERKRMRALDQPSTSSAAFALNPDDETAAATPMECSRSESDVKMVDLPVVVSPDKTSRRDGPIAIGTSTRYFSRRTLAMLEMCAIDVGLEKT